MGCPVRRHADNRNVRQKSKKEEKTSVLLASDMLSAPKEWKAALEEVSLGKRE
ncbi:hypothetical protein PRBEI_2001364200 [Prionailurus iriomotensis]